MNQDTTSNNSNTDMDWIEQYLNNQLAPNELARFEARLATDTDFASDVATTQQAHRVMQQAFTTQRAVDTLNRLRAQTKQKAIVRLRLRQGAGALIVAGGLVIAFLSLAPIQLADRENDYSVTRTLVDDSTASVSQKRVFAHFFDGQAHLAEGQYALAVQNFEQVLKAPDIRAYFREAAQWHLAVAYLKSGQPRRANRILTTLNDCDDCDYSVSMTDRWKLWWQIQWATFFA